MGITQQLSDFTAGIRLNRLPPEVVDRARFLVLDLVGNIVRARHDAERPRRSWPRCMPWGWPRATRGSSAMPRAIPRRARRS